MIDLARTPLLIVAVCRISSFELSQEILNSDIMPLPPDLL